MVLLGRTSALVSEAHRHGVQQPFRAWMNEARKARWHSAEEIRRRYPRSWRLEDDSFHVSLTPEDIGVRFAVSFEMGVVRAFAIAAAPEIYRFPPNRPPTMNAAT